MRVPHLVSVFSLLAFASLHAVAGEDRALPLLNPGFEEGLAHWTIGGDDPTLAAVAESAASLGRRGLRVTIPPGIRGFTVDSSPLPVVAGKSYRVEFWHGGGRPDAKGVQVEMIFHDASGAVLSPDRASIRKWPATQVSGGVFFTNPTLAAAAPIGAATLTLRVKPYGRDAGGPVDIDDFRVFELADDAGAKPALAPGQGNPIPPSDPARIAALLDEIRANPYRGKSAPKIVIKLDDFKPARGGVHARWHRVADFAAERRIKVGFGIIAQSLDADSPAFFAWTKERHASGAIEFWFHGWDHSEEGQLREFSGRPYDYQKKHVVDSQRLAREKLGFAFRSFGAPFNAVDATAAQVIGEDPDLAVWMYGKPGETGGKLALERAFAVNLESPTIIANYGAFIEGYAHNRGAAYFVLQGHPAGWDDARYAEFVKIVDFLISQKAEFVHAAEFAARPDLRALLR